jgi:hypothetical protein
MSDVRDDDQGAAADAPQIFVSDASAEAAEVATLLRRAGYLVAEVPLGMLRARVAMQRPNLVIVDGEADGAVDEIAAVQALPECAALDVLFVGRHVDGHAFVPRPIDAPALVVRVDAITGGARRAPSRRPSAPPSGRPSLSALPSPGIRASDAPARPPSIVPPAHGSRGSAPPASSKEEAEGSRAIVAHAALSPELQQLLAEAEAREMGAGDAPSELGLPSPDQEIEAVLPGDVLASLDEPIDEESHDESDPSLAPRPTTASGRGATGRRPVSDMPHSKTGSGTGAGSATTGARSDPGVSAGTGDHGTRGGSEVRTHPPAPSSSRPDMWTSPGVRVEGAGEARVAPPAAPTMPAKRRVGLSKLIDRPGSVPPAAIHEAPERAARDLPGGAPPRRALGPGDAARLLAFSIATRASGSVCFEDGGVVRRVVLREGDLVTAASGADSESLVGYLALRGDLPRAQAERLAARVPPFGRHAGAALVAHGALGQDQLWEALRGHAEWISVGCMKIAGGSALVEPEPPGRLKGEPSVFGGAAGSEVFVELCRRAFSAEEALAGLGGPGARLTPGANEALLRECGLAPDEERAALESRTHTVGEVVARAADGDVAAALFALVLLGVLDRGPTPIRGAATDPSVIVTEGEVLALEEEAVRARVKARLELVEEGDYFAVLGVARDATGYEIRRAFLDLRRSFEPARLLTPQTTDLLGDLDTINAVVEEAYDVLRDGARRERYRRAIES